MRDAGRRGWHRSSRCESSSCVEVAVEDRGVVLRDGSSPDGRWLTVDRDAWDEFLRWLKRSPGGVAHHPPDPGGAG